MRNTQSEKEVNKKRVQIQINFSIGYICTRGIVLLFFRAAKRVSIIIQSTNCECDVINVRSLNMFRIFYFTFRQKTGKCYDIFSLWLNWLKTRGGNSPFSPQPPYHATNRSLGKNSELYWPVTSSCLPIYLFPKSNVKSAYGYIGEVGSWIRK